MTVALWIGVFVVALAALVKGADYMLTGAERIGRYFKLPAFLIGALIIGVGTSLPELASSIAAVISNQDTIVVANAVGSNIANILLVVGLSAVVGRRIVSTKNLIDVEIPLLVISSSLFIVVAYDGIVSFFEALIMFGAFLVYLSYLLFHKGDSEVVGDKEITVRRLHSKDFAMLVGGGALLVGGAQYMIESVIELSVLFNIAPALIAVSAVAVGTSLPEIIVSVTAVIRGKTDLAFGNVFGSNVFNILMLVGTVGLFSRLSVDEQTLTFGLPFFAIVTVLFLVAATSKRIYLWEGMMFLLFYLFFLVKIFGFG